MDNLDRSLIAELRINGRASVPQLAQLLGVSRLTAQRRLDRLIENGDIKGFTVRLRDDIGEDQIRAVMLIELAGTHLKGVISAIKRMPGLTSVYNTNGTWDMVAEIEVSKMSEMNELISKIRSLEGVSKSETFVLLGPA